MQELFHFFITENENLRIQICTVLQQLSIFFIKHFYIFYLYTEKRFCHYYQFKQILIYYSNFKLYTTVQMIEFLEEKLWTSKPRLCKL